MNNRAIRFLTLRCIAVLLICVMLIFNSINVFAAMTEDELGQVAGSEVLLSDVSTVGADFNPENYDPTKYQYGYGTTQLVNVTGQAFTQARQFTTVNQLTNKYDLQWVIPVASAISKDDCILATFYARTISSTSETAEGKVSLVMEKTITWDKSINQEFSIPSTWKKLLIPIKAAVDMPAGTAQVTLRLGYKPQVIEIADLKVVNYKNLVTLDQLPSTPITYIGMEDDAPWRAEANSRIEQLRKGDMTVVVKDQQGNPVSDASVHVKMTNHAFRFGTAVNSTMINGTSTDSDKYRTKLKEMFNSVVMENEMKWPWWEGDKARTVNLYNWLVENKFKVRGHTLVWDNTPRLPADIPALVNNVNTASTDEARTLAKDILSTRIQDHIHEIAGFFRGKLVDWDVLNEPVLNHLIRDAYNDNGKTPADWLKAAKEADPNAKLYVNETQILGTDAPVISNFSNILQSMKNNGAPIDGIGIQAHFGSTPVEPMAFYNQLTHFAQYADEIAITEYDFNTPNEAIAAKFTRDMLIACFSHPNVESFTMWGFWDGAHWQNNAPLFRQDWTLKPAGEEWNKLIHETWWTDVTGTTGNNGAYSTRGFYGDYDIIVDYAGETTAVQTSLQKGMDNTFVVNLGHDQPRNDQIDRISIIPDQSTEITAPVWPYGSTPSITNYAPTSLTLTWPQAIDNMGVAQYEIYMDGALQKTVTSNILSYDVTNLTANKAYEFYIVAKDEAGNVSLPSPKILSNTSSGTDTTKPGWQKGSAINLSELTSEGVQVSWPAAFDNGGVIGYRVYVNDGLLEQVTGTSYTLSGLSEDTAYGIRVEAVDTTGNISTNGPAVRFKTLGQSDITPPTWNAPSISTSDISTNGLTLSWNGASDNKEVTAYRIFSGNKEIVTVKAEVSSFNVKGLLPYTSYDFKVEAIDAKGNISSTGPTVSVKTPAENDLNPPSWPADRNLTYSNWSDNAVTLNWSSANDNIEVTNYKVYCNGTIVTTVTGDVHQYEVRGLNSGTDYVFKVEAGDAADNWTTSGPSLNCRTSNGVVRNTIKIFPSDDTWLQAPDVSNPAGPGTNKQLSATAADREMLRFKNAAGVSGSDLNKNTGNNRRVFLKFPLNTITGTVDKATLNLYAFAVQTPGMAIGCDLYSVGDAWTETDINWITKPAYVNQIATSTVSGITWKTFDVKDYVQAEASGDKNASFGLQDSKWLDNNVDFRSKEFSDIAFRPYLSVEVLSPAADVDSPVWAAEKVLTTDDIRPDSVTLSWSGASDNAGINSYRVLANGAVIATLAGDVNTYNITGLQPETSYSFKVEAADVSNWSSNGPQIDVSTLPADTIAPAWLEAAELEAKEISRYEVTLEWPEAEDNYQVTAYKVYKGTTLIETVPGNQTSFKVVGLQAGTSYNFKVEAVDSAGNLTEVSLEKTVDTLEEDLTKPNWPEGISILASDLSPHGLMLKWGQATDDTLVTGYNIYQDDVKIAEVSADILNYYINGLNADTLYNFSIRAKDFSGNESLPIIAENVRTLQYDTITPQWRIGSKLSMVVQNHETILQWDAAVDNVAIKQYRLYRNGSLIATVDGETLTYTDTESGTEQVYKVEAVDLVGNCSNNGPATNDKPYDPVDTTPPGGTPQTGTTPSGGNTTVGNSQNDVSIGDKPGEIVCKPVVDKATSIAKIVISDKVINDVSEKVQNGSGEKLVTVDVQKAEGAKAYSITLPIAVFTTNGAVNKLEIKTDFADITVPGDMLSNADVNKTDGAITITIKSVGKSEITGDVANKVGGRPIVDISLTSNGKELMYNNPDAPVYLKIPYKPTAEELKRQEHIIAWYIDDNNNWFAIPSSKYDAATETVIVRTTHFSKYAVGYELKYFDDTIKYTWCHEKIGVMASKGIISGTSEKTFSPDKNISRGDFTLILVKALGLTAKVDSNFSDVSKDAYYHDAVGIAKKLKLVNGEGNNKFNPKEEISRQDAMVIIAKAMRLMNKLDQNSTSKGLDSFSDKSSVSAYALQDVAALVRSGIVQGSNGAINPKKDITRAEAAVLIYNVYNK